MNDIEGKYREILRRMTVEEKLRIVFELHEMGRELVRAGVRAAHPAWDHDQIEQEVKKRIYHDARRDSPVHPRAA